MTNSGIKTTEFWANVFVQVLAVAQLFAGGVSPAFAATVALFSTIVYTISRTITKSFGAGDSGAAVETTGTTASPPPAPSPFPRIATSLLIIMAILVAGCAVTENQRIASGAVALTVHAKTAQLLHDYGITNKAQEAKIVECLKAEQAAVHAYYDSIEAGDAAGVAAAKAALSAAVSVTDAELAKYPLPKP